ncbi:hypothetical protein Fmac_010893 [Flemingia macrophylla]|uniref:Uncharacterized protein n=1 Tax=Flemingia macrophylla TaxID=520843 RepID=A0ABD1MKV4_9FABA
MLMCIDEPQYDDVLQFSLLSNVDETEVSRRQDQPGRHHGATVLFRHVEPPEGGHDLAQELGIIGDSLSEKDKTLEVVPMHAIQNKGASMSHVKKGHGISTTMPIHILSSNRMSFMEEEGEPPDNDTMEDKPSDNKTMEEYHEKEKDRWYAGLDLLEVDKVEETQ